MQNSKAKSRPKNAEESKEFAAVLSRLFSIIIKIMLWSQNYALRKL